MNLDIFTLSVVQGISEILPVSSSVHLYIASKLFGITDFSFSLKIILHLGSLLALICYFFKDLKDIFLAMFTSRKKINETYLPQLIVGTIPVVIFGFAAKNVVTGFKSVSIMAISCIVFGFFLYFIDANGGKNTARQKGHGVSIGQALIVGIFQMIALFPGVSRLGICITASRLVGLSRKAAVEYSLILAIPSILGAVSLKVYELYDSGNLNALFTSNSLAGISLTFLFSIICIAPIVKYMQKNGFMLIGVYRIIIGIVLLFI